MIENMDSLLIFSALLFLSIGIPLAVSTVLYIGFISICFIKYILINKTYKNYYEEFLLNNYQFVIIFENVVRGVNGSISKLVSMSISGGLLVLLLTSEIHNFFKAFGFIFLFAFMVAIDCYLSIRIKLIFTKFLYPLVCKVLWNRRAKSSLLDSEKNIINELLNKDSRLFSASEINIETLNHMIENKYIYPLIGSSECRIQDWLWDSFKYYGSKI